MRKTLAPVLVAGAMIALVYATEPNFHEKGTSRPGFYGGDFVQEWVGAYILREGEPGRLYEREYVRDLQHQVDVVDIKIPTDAYMPTVYPPFYYLLLTPLSLLPLRQAAWVWAGSMVLALAGACVIFAAWARRYLAEAGPRTSPPAWLEDGRALWAIPLAILFEPVLVNLRLNQKGTVILALLTGVLLLLQRGRQYEAGAVLGLLAFKPQLLPVFLVVAIVKRWWRALAGFGGTVAVLAVFSLAVGPAASSEFVDLVFGASSFPDSPGYPLTHAHSLYGTSVLLMGGATSRMALVVATLGGVAVALMLAILFYGEVNTRHPFFPCQYSALVVAALLLSPHLLTYDLVALLIPLGCTALYLAGVHGGLTARKPLAWSLLLIWTLAGYSPSLIDELHVQLSTLLMLGFLASLCWERWGNRAGPSPA